MFSATLTGPTKEPRTETEEIIYADVYSAAGRGDYSAAFVKAFSRPKRKTVKMDVLSNIIHSTVMPVIFPVYGKDDRKTLITNQELEISFDYDSCMRSIFDSLVFRAYPVKEIYLEKSGTLSKLPLKIIYYFPLSDFMKELSAKKKHRLSDKNLDAIRELSLYEIRQSYQLAIPDLIVFWPE